MKKIRYWIATALIVVAAYMLMAADAIEPKTTWKGGFGI